MDKIIKIDGIPLADLLPRGAQKEIAKKRKMPPSYITKILNGEREHAEALGDLLEKALSHQTKAVPVESSNQEKMEKLKNLIKPVAQPA